MSDNTFKFLTVFLAMAALAVALVQTRHMLSTSPGTSPACTVVGSSTSCR